MPKQQRRSVVSPMPTQYKWAQAQAHGYNLGKAPSSYRAHIGSQAWWRLFGHIVGRSIAASNDYHHVAIGTHLKTCALLPDQIRRLSLNTSGPPCKSRPHTTSGHIGRF